MERNENGSPVLSNFSKFWPRTFTLPPITDLPTLKPLPNDTDRNGVWAAMEVDAELVLQSQSNFNHTQYTVSHETIEHAYIVLALAIGMEGSDLLAEWGRDWITDAYESAYDSLVKSLSVPYVNPHST